MSNKVMKFIPLLLIVLVIVDSLPMFVKSMDYTTTTWIVTISTMAIAAITSFIIFYADLKRNDSSISVFGMIAVGIFVVLTIINLILAKTMSSSGDFIVASTISKLISTTAAVLTTLRYVSIANLVSIENNSSTTNLFKTGAVISAAIIGVYGVVTSWTTVDITITNIATVTQSIFTVMIYSFILMQVIEAEEMLNKKATEVQQQPQQAPQQQFQAQQAPENNMFASNTPKFRNPALEAQEARIKEQQMNQQVNSTPTTPSFQIVNNNQPLINNNNPQPNQNNMNGNIQ